MPEKSKERRRNRGTVDGTVDELLDDGKGSVGRFVSAVQGGDYGLMEEEGGVRESGVVREWTAVKGGFGIVEVGVKLQWASRYGQDAYNRMLEDEGFHKAV